MAGGCLVVVAQWQSTGSSSKGPSFDSWWLPALFMKDKSSNKDNSKNKNMLVNAADSWTNSILHQFAKTWNIKVHIENKLMCILKLNLVQDINLVRLVLQLDHWDYHHDLHCCVHCDIFPTVLFAFTHIISTQAGENCVHLCWNMFFTFKVCRMSISRFTEDLQW